MKLKLHRVRFGDIMAVIKVDLNNVRNEDIDLLMFRNDLNRI